jgi:hypothetical protein
VVCRADDANLNAFQALCTYNCLQARYETVKALTEIQNQVTLWAPRLAMLQHYLLATTWIAGTQNPYMFPEADPNCFVDYCDSGTFRYALHTHASDPSFIDMEPRSNFSELYACIPCDETIGKYVCDRLFSEPRFYRHNVCMQGRKTILEVCDTCNLTLNHAELILSTDKSSVTGNDLYTEWQTFREVCTLH